MLIDELFTLMKNKGASDLHLTVGVPPILRINGELFQTPYEPLTPEHTQALIYSIMSDEQKSRFETKNELDFAFSIKDIGRIRVNVFRQRGCVGVAIRAIPVGFKTFRELGLPAAVDRIVNLNKGLILVTGPTGSGKSTIANLLCRYYDVTGGEVLIDGINVKEYDLQYLRKNVGITMQEAFLFSDTVEGNIAFGNVDASFEEVEKAAELARVKEFIGDLTDGYDTIVGERGVGLSGGQKQRIALARLFLSDPKIMILDDTTSAVDNDTEKKIRDSIKIKSGGHTMFIISHRVSSFENADVILVIQNGEITQSGTHEQLMAQDGYYRQVWEEQN